MIRNYFLMVSDHERKSTMKWIVYTQNFNLNIAGISKMMEIPR